MWNNAYSQTFDGDSLLGANYNYVVELPALGVSNVYGRLLLRAPGSGQSRVQGMYIGHGSGYSFDGAQVPVKVNGSTSFVLSSGTTYSDPILLSSFGFDPAKKILCAYGILNGDKYIRNLSLGSGFVLHYKTGTGDAATTAKTGYTSTSGRTAIVEGIQIVDVVPEETPNPEPEYGAAESYEKVLAGEMISAGAYLAGVAGKNLHFELSNDGTKNGFLEQVIITPDQDTLVSIRSYTSAIGTEITECNLMYGAGQGSLRPSYVFADEVLGVVHSIFKLRGGFPFTIRADGPIVGLAPGRYALVAVHAQGVGACCNMEWRERPIA